MRGKQKENKKENKRGCVCMCVVCARSSLFERNKLERRKGKRGRQQPNKKKKKVVI